MGSRRTHENRLARLREAGVAALALRGALDLISQAGGGVVEGYPHDMSKQPEGKKMSSSFLYNGTRRMYEEAGFTYQRPAKKRSTDERSKNSPDLGAPLRNRTVDRLLTMGNRQSAVIATERLTWQNASSREPWPARAGGR
jgi:hypothetical protein